MKSHFYNHVHHTFPELISMTFPDIHELISQKILYIRNQCTKWTDIKLLALIHKDQYLVHAILKCRANKRNAFSLQKSLWPFMICFPDVSVPSAVGSEDEGVIAPTASSQTLEESNHIHITHIRSLNASISACYYITLQSEQISHRRSPRFRLRSGPAPSGSPPALLSWVSLLAESSKPPSSPPERSSHHRRCQTEHKHTQLIHCNCSITFKAE